MSIYILVLKLFATKVTINNETNIISNIFFDAISLKTYPKNRSIDTVFKTQLCDMIHGYSPFQHYLPTQ
jgi:hypothetical protein